MQPWNELPNKHEEGSPEWTSFMARYQLGCPGINCDDICMNDQVECAVKGRCKVQYEKSCARAAQREKNKTLHPEERICLDCLKAHVLLDEDITYNECAHCLQNQYERYREREEFRHYHPE